MLQENAAGETAASLDADGGTDQGRHLLTLFEVGFDRLREGLALQRHDALVALVRFGDVEGDRQVSLAEQLEERRVRSNQREAFDVVFDVATQFAVAVVADH